MNTQPDFEEFLSLLQKHHVEYMVVGGGYAVALRRLQDKADAEEIE